MKISACLFDLDGVIVDTAHYHFLAWRTLAKQLGFQFTEMDNERLKGVSRMESLNILLDLGRVQLNEAEKIKLADEKNQLYLTYIEGMTQKDVLPGVMPFLDELRNHLISVGIGSSSKNARLILNNIQMVDLFEVIVDGNLITHAKPHPEVYAMGASILKSLPSECVVFEDAVAGIRAAHKAGMRCVGIGSPEQLVEADLVIPGFDHFGYGDLMRHFCNMSAQVKHE